MRRTELRARAAGRCDGPLLVGGFERGNETMQRGELLARAAEPMAFGDGLQPGYGARQAEAEKIGERSSSGEGLGKLAVGAGRCRSGPLSRR